jgi:hypothetical protein
MAVLFFGYPHRIIRQEAFAKKVATLSRFKSYKPFMCAWPACSCVSDYVAKSDASIEDVDRPRCDFGFTHPLHRLTTGREGLKRLQNR